MAAAVAAICPQTFWQSYSTRLFIATFLAGTQAANKWVHKNPECVEFPTDYNGLLMPFYKLAPYPYDMSDELPRTSGEIQHYESKVEYELVNPPQAPPEEGAIGPGKIHYDYHSMMMKIYLPPYDTYR